MCIRAHVCVHKVPPPTPSLPHTLIIPSPSPTRLLISHPSKLPSVSVSDTGGLLSTLAMHANVHEGVYVRTRVPPPPPHPTPTPSLPHTLIIPPPSPTHLFDFSSFLASLCLCVVQVVW